MFVFVVINKATTQNKKAGKSMCRVIYFFCTFQGILAFSVQFKIKTDNPIVLNSEIIIIDFTVSKNKCQEIAK